MQIGYLSTTIDLSLKQCWVNSLKLVFLVFFLIIGDQRNHVESSLLIGAIFSNDGASNWLPGGNLSTSVQQTSAAAASTSSAASQSSSTSTVILVEADEEIVFKHAVYISNQNKMSSNGGGGGGIMTSGLSSAGNPAALTTLLHKIIHVSQDDDQLRTIKKICQETTGNLLALIGPHDEALKMYARSLAEQLDLVHFDVDPALESTYSFNLYPATDVMCQAFSDLIRRFEWRHLAIIYNSITNLKKVKCLLSGPGQSVPKLDITLRIVNFDYEYRLILRDLSRRSIRNIVLDLEPDESQVVLKMALQLGMINSSYHFILTTLDVETMNLDDFKYNRANITAFRLIKSNSTFFKTIALNLTDYYSNSFSAYNDKNKILLNTKHALMFDTIYSFSVAIKAAERSIRGLESGNVSCPDDKHLEAGFQLTNFVANVKVNGLTGSISFQNKQRREFDLDVLQLKETGLFKCGTWSTQNGLNFTFYDELLDDDMYSYRKNIFRVVTLVEEPYVIEKDGKFEGFCIDILNEVSRRMNFRYEIYKVPDNQYGSEDANGTWNGMIRELIDKRADLAISSLTINFKRQQVVDFTKPFLNLGISILYKVPRSKKPGLFSFLNPLSLEIWIYTMITYLLISLIMMILARFSPYEWRNKHPCNLNNEYVENQFTVCNSLWFAMGTLMQQGSDINPKALSTRLVGGVWWFFTLIIISSYTANLAAFLTVEKFDISITNVEQLANQSKVSYGVFKGGSTMNFFKESRIDTYRRMWSYMERNPDTAFVPSNAEGIKRVHQLDFAFLMESPNIDYEIQKNCSLTQIGGLLDTKGYGIATQLGSPYTDDISLEILEMQESSTIQKFYNQWWKSGSTCLQNEKKDTKPDPLKVENVGGIFVVLVGGLLLACVVSLFEFLYFAKQNSSKMHKPLCSQMLDDLRFAIKCGGSAKKVQLSGSTAVPLKKLTSKMLLEQQRQLMKPPGDLANAKMRKSASESSYLGGVGVGVDIVKPSLIKNTKSQQLHKQVSYDSDNEDAVVTRPSRSTTVPAAAMSHMQHKKKCSNKEMSVSARGRLIDNITAENALVCKHDSMANLSIHNPGLLIVDKETANSALLRQSTTSHIHAPISSNVVLESTPFGGGLSSKKSPKKRSQTNLESEIVGGETLEYPNSSNKPTTKDQQSPFDLHQHHHHYHHHHHQHTRPQHQHNQLAQLSSPSQQNVEFYLSGSLPKSTSSTVASSDLKKSSSKSTRR